MTIQLDLFSSQEMQILNTNVQSYKDSSDKVRRGVFARLDTIKKEVEEKISFQQSQIDQMHEIIAQLRNNLVYFDSSRSA